MPNPNLPKGRAKPGKGMPKPAKGMPKPVTKGMPKSKSPVSSPRPTKVKSAPKPMGRFEDGSSSAIGRKTRKGGYKPMPVRNRK